MVVFLLRSPFLRSPLFPVSIAFRPVQDAFCSHADSLGRPLPLMDGLGGFFRRGSRLAGDLYDKMETNLPE